MGVADNKTYKDSGYFVYPAKKGQSNMYDLSSIYKENDINTSIKENPYVSNVEIEKDEIVLNPDLSGLFKANGKKHRNGGIDVYLKPDSFVFSDDKELLFNEEDHELFEFKKPSKFNNTTPAEVLKKNVDIKHYNTLISNITDPKKDDLAKNSSIRMLDKYIQSLGNIAFLQESKKDFPQGIPEFSNGTAPVYRSDIKEEIEENNQYMKYGGKIENPYLQKGGYGPYSSQEQKKLPWSSQKRFQEWVDNAKQFGYQGDQSIAPLQQFTSSSFPGVVDDAYRNNYLRINNLGVKNKYNIDGSLNTQDQNNTQFRDGLWGVDRVMTQYKDFNSQKEMDDWMKVQRKVSTGNPTNPYAYLSPNQNMSMEDFLTYYIPRVGQPNNPTSLEDDLHMEDLPNSSSNQNDIPNSPYVIPTPNQVQSNTQGVKRADWEFTPWQKISQAYNWSQYAGAKRYMPYRSRYNATFMDPQLVNPEQVVGDMKNVSNKQIDSLNTLSPIVRNAQSANIYGQLLDRIPGVRSQYDNQNVGIINQSRQYNNQIKNQETLQNLQNDQNYYRESVIGRQNFDNMRQFLSNQAMDNVMRDVETNQSLSYNLLTQNKPAYGFDWKTGNFTRNNKSILDVNSVAPQDTWENMVGEVQKMKNSGMSDQLISAIVRGKFFQQAAPYFQQQGTPPPFKKGGKIKNPYK